MLIDVKYRPLAAQLGADVMPTAPVDTAMENSGGVHAPLLSRILNRYIEARI